MLLQQVWSSVNKLLKFIRQQLYLGKLPTTSATSNITEISRSPYPAVSPLNILWKNSILPKAYGIFLRVINSEQNSHKTRGLTSDLNLNKTTIRSLCELCLILVWQYVRKWSISEILGNVHYIFHTNRCLISVWEKSALFLHEKVGY